MYKLKRVISMAMATLMIMGVLGFGHNAGPLVKKCPNCGYGSFVGTMDMGHLTYHCNRCGWVVI